jgi:hypothetical protein
LSKQYVLNVNQKDENFKAQKEMLEHW